MNVNILDALLYPVFADFRSRRCEKDGRCCGLNTRPSSRFQSHRSSRCVELSRPVDPSNRGAIENSHGDSRMSRVQGAVCLPEVLWGALYPGGLFDSLESGILDLDSLP